MFLFLFILAITTKAGVQEGIEAYNQSDYSRAIDELRPLAERGDSYAQFYLGLVYENGQTVQDYKEAIILYEKAAKAGYGPAQTNLSLLVAKVTRLNVRDVHTSDSQNWVITTVVFGVVGIGVLALVRSGYLKWFKPNKTPKPVSWMDQLEKRARRFKEFADNVAVAVEKAISELLEASLALLGKLASWLVEIANRVQYRLKQVARAIWEVIEGLFRLFKVCLPGVLLLFLAWAHIAWR